MFIAESNVIFQAAYKALQGMLNVLITRGKDTHTSRSYDAKHSVYSIVKFSLIFLIQFSNSFTLASSHVFYTAKSDYR